MENYRLELANLLRYNVETADYLFHLSRKFNYLYAATAKAGSSYVLRQLQYAELDFDASKLADEPHDRTLSTLMSPLSDMDAFRTAINGGAFKFCFVRNPYSRALSCFLDKFQQDPTERTRLNPDLGFEPDKWPSFWEFLDAVRKQRQGSRDIHWETQSFHLRPDIVRYSFIGRFENFGSDFAKLVHILNMQAYTDNQDRHRTAATTRLKEFYGPAEKMLVEEIYAEDFRTFGYGYGLESLL